MKTGLFRCRCVCFAFFSMVAAAWGQTPSISGVVNAASSAAGGIAPGEGISIYGANLSTLTNVCTGGGTAPTTCSNTQVLVNGNAIPLQFVSPAQVNALVPFGLTGSTAAIQVSTPGGQSSPMVLNVVPASPGIVTQNGSLGFFQFNGALITATNTASPGETLVGYAYGLGITNPAVADGTPAPSSPPLANAAATVNVTVGGAPAAVIFGGLAPGNIGLYQINFTVPAGLLGNQPVVFTVDGIASPSVTLPLAAGSPTSVFVTSSSNLGTWPLGEVQVG